MGSVSYHSTKHYEIIQYTDRVMHYPEHNHASTFTLGFVLDGTVTLITGGKKTDYDKDSFFIIQPYEPHELILPQTYKLVTVCFQSEYVLSHRPAQILDELSFKTNRRVQVNTTLLESAIAALNHKIFLFQPPKAMAQRAMFLRLHPEDQMDIEEMAQAENISKYHFIRMFKRIIGITPHRFQLQSRIRKAQKLIETGMPLADVALAAGFFDQSHFVKSFKKLVGLTPTEYKQSVMMPESDD